MRVSGSRFGIAFLLAGLACCPVVAAPAAEDAIAGVLHDQVVAWNRGDLPAFVQSYAPHCTLVGNGIAELTREQVLAHYREKYPSAAVRGVLTFSGLAVHLLDDQSATATGHWRVERDKSAGGGVGGVFSVVLKLVDGSWQIVLDHTS